MNEKAPKEADSGIIDFGEANFRHVRHMFEENQAQWDEPQASILPHPAAYAFKSLTAFYGGTGPYYIEKRKLTDEETTAEMIKDLEFRGHVETAKLIVLGGITGSGMLSGIFLLALSNENPVQAGIGGAVTVASGYGLKHITEHARKTKKVITAMLSKLRVNSTAEITQIPLKDA